MQMRAPAVPLITVDPYFSVWSPSEKLNFANTMHWTGSPMPMLGFVTVDGERKVFLGYNRFEKKIEQTAMDVNALSTFYTFEDDKIRLFLRFMTPALPKRYEISTRPVSYLALSYEKKDESVKDVGVTILVSSAICLNKEREMPLYTAPVSIPGAVAAKIGGEKQAVLNRSGDNLRIDWGYFYLGAKGEGSVKVNETENFGYRIIDFDADKNAETYEKQPFCKNTTLCLDLSLTLTEGEERLCFFAYDDIRSINYFGKELPSYWNKDGKKIETAIEEALADFDTLKDECDAFSDQLIADAYMAGGEKYADMLTLSYRQVMGAHKLAVDEDGSLLWISKECFSNGCAATVDVSYPSSPMFLLYDPEMLRAMMRPIYKFAASKAWKYDYAPHDAGQYPLIDGQRYGLRDGELLHEKQMPVEECGNMILLETATALASGDTAFASSHFKTLEGWCDYLIRYGDDPENQLCTDDFAGHLAHNCNLALKAIMGIMGMSILYSLTGHPRSAAKYKRIAKEKAESWLSRAKNPDGSYRLTFDKEGSYSMKYNAVWDKVFGTKLFPASFFEDEIQSNFKHFNTYGMPLDSRADNTKSDWTVWCATMAKKPADFKRYIEPLFKFYCETVDRVPMTDWYDTVSNNHLFFQNRTVQGGLFMKLLDASGKCKFKK